ncbi:hypothetical protein [Caballeronia sp. INSB1]|uniref:hypothetical protein n=1 Tax=Caballeronia sp. INSB1 TaxID=2921751 RepID=UPI0020331628|nr:hypothetical protein [Caballeronia sp. INSB1]
MRPSGGRYPEYVFQDPDGLDSNSVKAKIDAALLDHLRTVEALQGAPLDVLNGFEETDFFPDDPSRFNPIALTAAYAIWCIDQGILALYRQDAPRSAAAFAYALSTLDLAHTYRQQLDDGPVHPIGAAMSALGRSGAAARHARDPKQKDKLFVRECWEAWQAKPAQYKGKAAFSRDMLAKCEHLESNKQIEDWCRAWEKEAKTS